MREPEGRADVQRPMRRLNPNPHRAPRGPCRPAAVVCLLREQPRSRPGQAEGSATHLHARGNLAGEALRQSGDLRSDQAGSLPARRPDARQRPGRLRQARGLRLDPDGKSGSRSENDETGAVSLLGLAIARPSARRRGSRRQANALRRCGLHRTAGRGRQRQRRIAAKRGSHCYSARDAHACSATSQPEAAPQPGLDSLGQPMGNVHRAAPTAPVTQAPAPRPVGARPSFDCGNARTRGEVAVCTDAGLATLDRTMAAQYGRAMAVASPEQQALLRRTRDRFLGFRDRCADNRCIGDAYTGRMREIRDIMEGRWQAPR